MQTREKAADNGNSRFTRQPLSKARPVTRIMNKDTQVRASAVLLALSTIAVIVFAWINLQKEAEFAIPYEGVLWLETSGSLVADHVQTEGPAQRGGIKPGDLLVAINGQPVTSTAGLTRNLYRI